MQFSLLLQCSFHCRYNATLAAATALATAIMQLSLLLKCSSRRQDNAVLADASIQLSLLLQCSYNTALAAATM